MGRCIAKQSGSKQQQQCMRFSSYIRRGYHECYTSRACSKNMYNITDTCMKQLRLSCVHAAARLRGTLRGGSAGVCAAVMVVDEASDWLQLRPLTASAMLN